MIQGKFSICKCPTHVLIDTGATHSFVSLISASFFNVKPIALYQTLMVATPANPILTSSIMYISYIIEIVGRKLLIDLILLEMHDFDVIL